MAVVERYYWEPNDLEEFFSLHREIYDQHLRKAGASDMTLWQDRSNWKLYVAEAWFENFAAFTTGKPISKQRKEETLMLELMLQLRSLSVCSIQALITNPYF